MLVLPERKLISSRRHFIVGSTSLLFASSLFSTPAFATPTLVANIKLGDPGGSNGGTTTGIDTTGANLIVIGVSCYFGTAGSAAVSDNKGNTYTALSIWQNNVVAWARLYYCSAPSVGSGHTFTLSGSGIAGTMCVAAFSGLSSSTQFDQQTGSAPGFTGVTTVTNPSLTATNANSLFVTVLSASDGATGTFSIDQSFTITDQQPHTTNIEGCALAYKIATTQNPTWTSSTTATYDLATGMATFNPDSSGSSSAPPSLTTLGTGP